MITTQHIQEQLSRAYVTAVIARAGANLYITREHDYGIDGTIKPVTLSQSSTGKPIRSENGIDLDFQLKATINCKRNGSNILYKCKRSAYEKMLAQNTLKGAASCLLIVLCLPQDPKDWLTVDENGLVIKQACYYYHVKSAEPKLELSVPKANLFTPDALKGILNTLEKQDGKL